MYDIKIGNTSVAEEAEEEKEKISDKYWENEDADGFDEPQLIDEPVLDEYVEKLIKDNTDV